MPFGRKKRAARDRDPFDHLADERRAAESEAWFLEPDDGPALDVADRHLVQPQRRRRPRRQSEAGVGVAGRTTRSGRRLTSRPLSTQVSTGAAHGDRHTAWPVIRDPSEGCRPRPRTAIVRPRAPVDPRPNLPSPPAARRLATRRPWCLALGRHGPCRLAGGRPTTARAPAAAGPTPGRGADPRPQRLPRQPRAARRLERPHRGHRRRRRRVPRHPRRRRSRPPTPTTRSWCRPAT